jgi:hypothetical protein
MIRGHQERLRALDPTNESALRNYQKIMTPAWERTLQVDWPMKSPRVSERVLSKSAGFTADELSIAAEPDAEAVSAVLFLPRVKRNAAGPVTVVLASPDDAAPSFDASGAPRGLARRLLHAGFAVARPEWSPVHTTNDPTSLFYLTYNRTLLQQRVGDLMWVCQGLRSINTNSGRIDLVGSGAAGLWCLLSAPAADAVAADCDQVNATEDAALLDPALFCPGIRNMDTFEAGAILAGAHPLLLQNAAANFPVGHLKNMYETRGVQQRLRITHDALDDDQIAAWISAWAK